MSSSGWLWLFIGCGVIVGVVATVKATKDDSPAVSGVATGVDLDSVIETFKTSGGAKDLQNFEDQVNARGLYPAGRITVSWSGTGRPAIVGFVDNNANRVYDHGLDKRVFQLEIERRSDSEYRVIASDGQYYRHHSIVGDLATMYVAGSLMNMLWFRHAGLYGYGPRMVYSYSYAPRGYYRAPAYSRGSFGGRSTGGRVGGK